MAEILGTQSSLGGKMIGGYMAPRYAPVDIANYVEQTEVALKVKDAVVFTPVLETGTVAQVVQFQEVRTQFPATIIPKVVVNRYDALGLYTTVRTSAVPANLLEAIQVLGIGIGTMLLHLGSSLLMAMPVAIGEEMTRRLGYQLDSKVRISFRTSRGPGRGKYQRIRPEGGAPVGDDSDPYQEPCDWYQFWCWLV